jgi:hypothetical protein
MIRLVSFTRGFVALVASLMIAITAPTLAQTPKSKPEDRSAATQPDGDGEIRVFPLAYASPRELSRVVAASLALRRLSVAVDDRSNSLIVSAAPDVLADVEALVRVLDHDTGAPRKVSPEYFSLPSPATPDLLNALKMVVSDQARVSAAENLLVVVGTEQDYRAASELVQRVTDLRGRPRSDARGLQVSFYFLRTSIGPDKSARAGERAAALPEGMKPAISALGESGFQNAELLAPLSVQTGVGSEPFELRGSAPHIEQIGIKGFATPLAGQDAVELRIETSLSARVPTNEVIDPSGNIKQYNIKQIFSLQTTIQARLGDYLVLAASPSQPGEDAIALVVRVTAVP